MVMLKKSFGVKRVSLLSVGLMLCITLAMVARASFAQEQPAPQAGQPAVPGQPAQATGPAVDTLSTTYREPKQDPFLDLEKIKKNKDSGRQLDVVTVVPWPNYEEREAEWKQKRDEVRSGKVNGPEPAPSERYLVDELQVMGLFKKPEGQGVFLKPKPTATQ